MTATATRVRRTQEQLVADLEAKIAALKAKAERKKVQRDPSLKHMSAAMRSIDAAANVSDDAPTRRALSEARATISACLSMMGAAPSQRGPVAASRSRGAGAVDASSLLAHVTKNPNQRGEQIAAALGTDATTMRPVMKRLIDEKKIRTKGQRRGMTYAAI